MTTSSRQDKEMANIVLENCSFEVDSGGEVIYVVGDFTRLVEYVADDFLLEELYSDSALEEWALNHGFVKGE